MPGTINNEIKIIDKPWGCEWWFAVSDKYVGKIIFIKKGHRLSLQYHEKKHETQFIDEGKVKFTIGDKDHIEDKILGKGTQIILEPGTWHRIEALEDTKIIEVSTPELTDVVRIEDDYHREGTSDF